MSAIIQKSPDSSAQTKPSTMASRQHLIGPAADFLLLGGASLFVLPLIPFVWPNGTDPVRLAAVMLFFANLINHPHFAHSYQLFYRDFGNRAFGTSFPTSLRYRYVFAAIAVPLLLVVFFAYCVITGSASLLGWAANLMFFLVGWHYVKQGYGMLMVDAVLKRRFFDERGKKVLLWNAYAVWILSWILLNRAASDVNFWGIKYLTFAFPDWLLYSAASAVTITTLAAGNILFHKIRQGKAPVNGVVAYLVSLYVWLLTTHPALLLVIPAFHSLQYLTVVWRYRFNMEQAGDTARLGRWTSNGPWFGFGVFVLVGCALGYFAFWRVPFFMDLHVNYDKQAFGGALFLFLFWIFINVHHYFLDNVMWRKDNPDTRRYLFGSG